MLVITFIFYQLISCLGNSGARTDFLIGTWKVQGKSQYEVWEKGNDNQLTGYSYKIIDKQKLITETMKITQRGDTTIYVVSVVDQNEGKPVVFTLKDEIQEYLSFENPTHDFPKKIQYRKMSDYEIKVILLGGEGKSYSYRQVKKYL